MEKTACFVKFHAPESPWGQTGWPAPRDNGMEISDITDFDIAEGNITVHMDDALAGFVGATGHFHGSEGEMIAGYHTEPPGYQEDQTAKVAFGIDAAIIGYLRASGQIHGQLSEADGGFTLRQGV